MSDSFYYKNHYTTVDFWTEAGGCNRHDSFPVSSTQEIKDLIFDDLKENPYINFWYGQYIDIIDPGCPPEDRQRLYTHDKDGPIKMKLTVNGNSYPSMDSLKNVINENSDDESLYDIVTDAFEMDTSDTPIEILEESPDKTYLKLRLGHDECEMILEYTIDYSLLPHTLGCDEEN